MNRTLRRPMFRIGGVAEGITSGLSRQGYERGRVVNPGGYRGVPEVSHRGMPTFDNSRTESPTASVTGGGASQLDILGKMKRDLPGILEMSKAVTYKPRGTNVYDFMTEMGLDLASRPAAGGIFQQLATSAKEPYQRFMERKQSAAEQEYGSEADMFKTMLGVYDDITAAERGSDTAGKILDKENTARLIGEWITNLDKNEKLLQGEDLSKDKRAEIELQIQIDRTNLRNIKKRNIYAEAILKSDQYVKGFVGTIMEAMITEKLPNGKLKYPLAEADPNLYPDAFQKFMSYFETEYATGGRVGYQGGNAVMPGATQATSTGGYDTSGLSGYDTEGGFRPSNLQGFSDQGEEVPEELQNIDFGTLRARLPSSITDDIVRLIATSAEAMEDFATIQTQQDINNFNEKYGVELVLPAEA